MRAAFYAHSLAGRPPENWEPLEDHLRLVADLVGKFASSFGAKDPKGSPCANGSDFDAAQIRSLRWRPC
jgi:hypothetical protein